MKIADIKVGRRYQNKNGSAERLVVRIGEDKAEWYSCSPPPDEPAVYYLQTKGPYSGKTFCFYISSFAKWAAKEAPEPTTE